MCRLEKFHLPLRPNLKDWNMMTLNKKWMRLMVLVGGQRNNLRDFIFKHII